MSLSNRFNKFGAALAVAQPGVSILVLPATFALLDEISTVRDGTANQPITIAAYDPNQQGAYGIVATE